MNSDARIPDTMKNLIVAIDGPAGSGKSTTASILAGRLGLRYLDTGAMYRAVTYAVLERGIDPESETGVTDIAGSVDLTVQLSGGAPVLLLDGKKVDREIRSSEVSRHVSNVSRYPGVRRAMVALQRRIGRGGGVVAEGRDTGSVVFPFAHVKVFIVADIEARAGRRRKQLESMGIEQGIEEIRENIEGRDRIDSGREHSPLVRPPGSLLVDTSVLTIDQQVSIIEKYAASEARRLADLSTGRGERDPFSKMLPYYRISHTVVRWFFRLVYGLRIVGAENLAYRENYIFASNHLSYTDPPAVGCALNREVWFVAKKELFGNPLFAWLIRTYHAIEIDREEISRRSIKTIVRLLREGGSVLMFPEGTRSRTGEIGDFKSGIGFIALFTGTTVVPVHVTGTNDLRNCFLRRKKLEIRIGPPIRAPRGTDKGVNKDDYRVLGAMVRNELGMLKDEAEA